MLEATLAKPFGFTVWTRANAVKMLLEGVQVEGSPILKLTGIHHLYYITPGYQLVGLYAATVRPLPNFGYSGMGDLKNTVGSGSRPTE